MSETLLDRAFEASAQSEQARLSFFATLADTELFVLLERAAADDSIEPRLFLIEGQDVVLAFDTEARLATFAQASADYAAIPGRVLAQMLQAQGLGLGLNLDVAPSAQILPADALAWLVETLQSDDPEQLRAAIKSVAPPAAVPPVLLDALGAKLTQAGGIAEEALLCAVRYGDDSQGHMLAIIGANARAEPALARSVSEALVFSGIEAGFLDVGFFAPDAPIVERLRGAGALRFELPKPEPRLQPAAPGSDRSQPPKLR